jgi:peroxiredoxin
MEPLRPGSPAPPVPGVEFGAPGTVLFFYKVTCPVCQLAAPKVQTFERAYPGRIVGVGQDPPEKLAAFASRYGQSFPTTPGLPPYEVSNAYGIRVVPTVFLVRPDGAISAVAESWDREGFNEISLGLAGLTGLPYAPISEESDGLPGFRPG